jgi:hypothetical protein
VVIPSTATVPVVPPKPRKLARDCENPFTIDPNGIKRPKPECFE